MASLRLVSLLITTCNLLCVSIATTKTLYIGGLFDFNANDAQRVISAAKTAIQEINSNSFVPGYDLELLVNNTRDYDFTSASGVYNYLNSGPKKIMLLGPADNDIAKAIAHHAGAPSYGVLQFSYGTNDLYLSNYRGLYPYFFRTSISMATFDDIRIAFLKYYGWTEVGIVYGDSIHGAKLSNNLKTRIESQSKIKVLAEVRLQANDPERAVRTIQDKNIHVIIGLFPLDIAARRLFCHAHRHGLYGPHYIWLLQMAKNNGWWNPSPGEDIGGCQSIEMACQIRNYFSVKPAKEDYDSKAVKLSNSKKNTSHVLDTLRSEANVTAVDDVMMYAYDAVWSIAHVLANSNLAKGLENVTYYGDTSATNAFYSEALKLDFKTPNLETVRFFQNGDRKFEMSVEQVVIKDENSNPVSEEAGTYSLSTGSYSENKVSWPANTPYRKITETRHIRFIHRALFGAMIFLACLGILYAIVCFIVVLVFRKQSIIWNSSPVINIIIILGCILNYITIILYAFDWTTTANTTSFCRARAWTFAIGFTLSVGGLVAKLWIAYCVLSERFVRRWKNILIWMLAIILFLFILDLIIMGCWEGMDPLYATKETYREQEVYKCFQPITDKTFQAYYYTVEHCTCSTPLAWLLIILILKFLVVIFGVFLAWQTRKLYIKSLNDTQYCAFCLFIIFFFVVFGVLIALLTTRLPNLFFSVVGIFLFICTTIILGLLFIHKMARVVCKPRRGKRILVTGTDSDTESTSSSNTCTCCRWSGACCIACCGCFPCCNMFLCCRSCCLGSKIHPSESSSDDKTEFYIAGQPQDKEGQIAYLLREIHERDEELARLRPKHTSTSMWTQTYDDDIDEYQEREDGDGSSMESDNSDGSLDSSGKRRKRKTSRFKIYNQGVDYSHVRSKVDSGIAKSPSKSPKTKRKHDEKYYLGVWKSNGGKLSDAEITKLRAQLEEKDKEIEKLRNEKEGETSVVIHQPNSPNSKITIVKEKTPDTQEKQCQTDDSVLHIDHSPNDKPNNVVVVMETPVKNEEPPRDKPDDVIVVMEKPVKNKDSPRDKPNNDVIVVMETLGKTESSPSKKPAKGKKNVKTEPKENVKVVEVKNKNAKKKSKKEKAKSPDEWLFGKPEDEKRDVNVIVVTQPPMEEEKKDEPVMKEDEKTTVVIIRPEEPEKTEENSGSTYDQSVTNVIIVNADQENKEDKDEEEEKKKEEERRLEEERKTKEEEEKQKEEEQRKEEEKREEQEKKEEEERKRIEEKKQEEERKRQEEEEKRKEEEEERKRIEGEERKQEKEKKEEEEERKRKEEEERKRKEQEEKQKEEEKERKRKEEEEERKQEEERKRQEEEERKEEERKRKEQEEKQKEEEKKVDKPNEDIDDEETIPIRPPQNTPASVDGPQQEENKEDEQINNDDVIEEEEDKEPEQENDNDNDGGDEKANDNGNGNGNDKDGDNDGDNNENGDDSDDDDASGTDEDGDGENDDNKDEEEPSDEKEDKKKSPKPKKKPRKPIGGKLNWNATSKIDTSSGYKKKPRSKIKTYKVDYSHVKSKYSYGVTKKDQDDKKEKEEKEKEKKKKPSVKGKRWNPDKTNTRK